MMRLLLGKEGVVGHYAWHLEFLGDLAEIAGQIRKKYTFFRISQEKGSLKKVVVKRSIE